MSLLSHNQLLAHHTRVTRVVCVPVCFDEPVPSPLVYWFRANCEIIIAIIILLIMLMRW